jgi:hypothetical protein
VTSTNIHGFTIITDYYFKVNEDAIETAGKNTVEQEGR